MSNLLKTLNMFKAFWQTERYNDDNCGLNPKPASCLTNEIGPGT